MKVAKFIVAALGAGVVAATAALTDDQVTNSEIITVGLAILTALGVYVVPNRSA